MRAWTWFVLFFGIFVFLLGFLPSQNPLYPTYGSLSFRISYWIIGSICFACALGLEIEDVESTSENFQRKKREPVQIVVKGYVSGGWTENDLNNLIASNTVKADYVCVLKSPIEVEIAEVLSLAIRHEKCDFITVTRLVEGKLRGVLHD